MKNIRVFISENFQFLEVKFSIYLNRRVFIMCKLVGNTVPGSFPIYYTIKTNLRPTCLLNYNIQTKQTGLDISCKLSP